VSWSQGPDLLPDGGQTVWRPEVFGDEMVYLTLHNGFQISRLFRFDGTTAGQAYQDPVPEATSLFRDYAVAGEYLYGLLGDGRLLQTRDLDTWTVFDTAPASARSLTVHDRVLFVGTEDSQLLAYSAIVPETFDLGDMDGNGQVDNFDIGPFELALTNTSAYIQDHPAVTDWHERGDLDGSGAFDNFDIGPFEQLLTSPPPASLVPEPSTLALAVCATVLAIGKLAQKTSSRRERRSTGFARAR
jgi:hypothetical protein